jgi:hypothetical protein
MPALQLASTTAPSPAPAGVGRAIAISLAKQGASAPDGGWRARSGVRAGHGRCRPLAIGITSRSIRRSFSTRIAPRDKLPFPVHLKVILTRDGVVLSFVPSFHSVQPCELL